jgi:hypothetical protein
MTGAELNIIVKAQVNDAITNLLKVDTALGKTAAASKQASGKMSKDFTGLNRIIQDLPFGFVAISNNIEQLFPAAGALGLAISAITAAITFVNIGFGAWTRGLGENKAALEENKKSHEAIINDAGKEIGRLVVLTNAAKDVNLSMTERVAAVKLLQKELPSYFGQLSQEKILNGEVADAINQTTEALFARAIVRQKESELGPVAAQLFDLKEQRKELEKQEAVLKRMAAVTGQTRNRQGIISSLLGAGTQDQNAIADIGKQIAAVDKQIAPLQGKFKGLAQAIIDASEEAGKGIFSEDVKDAAKKSGDTIAKILTELNHSLDLFADKRAKGFDTTNEEISAFESAIGRLTKLNIPAADTLINKMFGNIAELKLPETLKAGQKIVNDQPIKVPYTPVIIIGKETEEDIKKRLEATQAAIIASAKGMKIPLDWFKLTPEQREVMTKNFDALKAFVLSTLTNVAVSIGESIGNLFSGQKDPFSSFINVLAEGIKALGKAYVQIGIEALIAKKAIQLLMKNPYLTIAAGIALIALGQVLTNKANKTKAFAAGGVVTSPTLAMVGEQGPERITPLGYEGAANNIGIPETIQLYVRGNDLYTVLRRDNNGRYYTF